jgi:uncharacterized protein YggE
MQSFFGEYTPKVAKALAILIGILSIFILIKGVQALKEYKFIGSGTTATNTIVVSGEGEAFAVPDIAEVRFTASKDAKTMQEAQKSVTDTANKALAYLKEQGIEEKDIKTQNYNAYPKYEWQTRAMMPCLAGQYCPPSDGKNVLVGYTVTETISVKIRDTEKAGTIVTGLGALGVTDISGPDFTVDDDEVIKAEARGEAIANAKDKAEALAKELGVKLVRIVNFSENGNNPYPMYSMTSKDMAYGMGGAAVPEAAPLPMGENKYTSNVTITYEIR